MNPLGSDATLDVAGVKYAVVGIASKTFRGLDLTPTDVWLPLDEGGDTSSGQAEGLTLIARLRNGVTKGVASNISTTLLRQSGYQSARENAPQDSILAGSIIPGLDVSARGLARFAILLTSFSLLVLAIACSNVANLLLGRVIERRHELSMRLALGCGTSQLVRLVVAEAFVLAGFAGMLAIGIAAASAALIRRVIPSGMDVTSAVDPHQILFAGGLILLATILIGLVPALQAATTEPMSVLRMTGMQFGIRGRQLRSATLVVQGVLASVLVTGSLVFVGALRNTSPARLNIAIDSVLVIDLEQGAERSNGAETDVLYHEAQRIVRRVAGVAGVTIGVGSPLQRSVASFIRVPGVPTVRRMATGGPYVDAVDADYSRVMGFRLIKGRFITNSDTKSSERVVVLNQTAARVIWAGREPLGSCVIVGTDERCRRVVGVMQNIPRESLVESETIELFIPLEQRLPSMDTRTLFIRTVRDPSEMMSSVSHALGARGDERIRPAIRRFRDIMEPEARVWRSLALLFSVYGALALCIASVGLFSVVSCRATERNRELGIRAALGATRFRLVYVLVSESARDVLTGIGSGLMLCVVVGKTVNPGFFDLSPARANVVLATAGVLIFTAAAALGLASLRVTQSTPIELIRD